MVMNFVIYIILIIIILFVALLIVMIVSRNNNYSGEDIYQNNRLIKNKINIHIYTTFYTNESNFLNLKNNIEEVINEHFKNNIEKRDYIIKNYKIEEESEEENNISNHEILWLKIKDLNPPILYIKYNTNRKRITILKDHRYFGGLFFLKLGGKITNTKPVTIYKEQYTPFLSELLILKFGIFWLTNKPKNSLKISNNIKRISFSYNYLEDSKKFPKVRKHTILCNTLLKIFDKNISVLLPVAFESTSKNYNNVGCIFVEYNKDDTPEILENKISSNKYQAIATNNLQKIISKGKKVRNSIDLVLTMGYLVGEYNNIKYSATSYLSIADYPIYIVSMTIENINYTTITLMTEDIDYDLLINKINENENIKINLFEV